MEKTITKTNYDIEKLRMELKTANRTFLLQVIGLLVGGFAAGVAFATYLGNNAPHQYY